jgi:myo-inositol-1(or 4)-monophosphatase
MSHTQISHLLSGMIAAASKAAQFIKTERTHFSYQSVEIKGLNDLVSYVDKQSEKMLVEALHALKPDAGFIVEENTATERKEYNWIVDPLDGTTNFVHGIHCYAVSIALAHHNTILAAVVYEVSGDECFYAEKGKGAFLNGEPIKVSPRKHLSESLIATGFPIYNFSRIESYLACLEHMMRNTHGVRRIGAAAADLCFLACGRVDAFFEYNLSPWDVAAGALIVAEAGGKVSDFNGGDKWLFGKEIVATNGSLYDEIKNCIVKHFS